LRLGIISAEIRTPAQLVNVGEVRSPFCQTINVAAALMLVEAETHHKTGRFFSVANNSEDPVAFNVAFDSSPNYQPNSRDEKKNPRRSRFKQHV
jgi:hypothetical protein